MTDRDDVTIEYTVKELLGDIKKEQAEGFTRIETAMAGKADKADVARLEERLAHQSEKIDQHETEIGALKEWRHGTQEVNDALTSQANQLFTRKQWVIGTAVALLLLFATLVAPSIHI